MASYPSSSSASLRRRREAEIESGDRDRGQAVSDRAPTLTVILWRDMPAQVVAKQGRDNHKIELAPRFQQAIDRAAMRAGAIGTDEYLEDWRRDSRPCGDDLAAEAQAEAAAIEDRFSLEVLNEYVMNLGYRGE